MPNATTPIQDRSSSDEDNDSQRNFAFCFHKHPVLAHVKGTGADLVISMSVLPSKKNVAVYRMAGMQPPFGMPGQPLSRWCCLR
jgi:hypothetical protein